jgi:hypothetical protein
MPEEYGTRAQGIIDVFPSEDVINSRSLAMGENGGEFPGQVELPQGTCGKDLKRSLNPTLILIPYHFHPPLLLASASGYAKNSCPTIRPIGLPS